eukprot:6211088-Pleurochrysis_carterae.AAC.2
MAEMMPTDEASIGSPVTAASPSPSTGAMPSVGDVSKLLTVSTGKSKSGSADVGSFDVRSPGLA